ncbi:MAG: Rrf2 family transcriptional regulator [Ramlibacter sp.]
MKLTAFTDYSLRVLMYLAARPGQRATIGQIATAYAISENHLVKVVHFLGKSGWLANVRGKGGGLRRERRA